MLMRRWLFIGLVMLLAIPLAAQRIDDDISAPTPAPTTTPNQPEQQHDESGNPMGLILVGVGVVAGLIVLVGVLRRPSTDEKPNLSKERPLPAAPKIPFTRTSTPEPVIQLVKPEPLPSVDDIPSDLLGPRLQVDNREFPLPTLLTSPFVIGLSMDSHLRLPDKYKQVSLLHCFIEKRSDGYYVMDGSPLGKPSEQGTFVNNERVIAPYPLYPGDMIRLGQQVSITFLT